MLTHHFKKLLTNLYISKSDSPKEGVVEQSFTIRTRFYRNIDEARRQINHLCSQSGANGILSLTLEKQTFSEGRYYYSVYAYSGELVLITKNVPCDRLEDEADSQVQLGKLILDFSNNFERLEAIETGFRSRQLGLEDNAKYNISEGYSEENCFRLGAFKFYLKVAEVLILLALGVLIANIL